MELKNIIAKGESVSLDFKLKIEDQKKIARTIAAFSNTEGGSILIGVKDNGKVAGCEPSEEYHMISGAAELFCLPPVDYESNVWQDGHKLVLEIIVLKNDNELVKALDEEERFSIYLRSDDHTIKANKVLLKALSYKAEGVKRPEVLDDEAIEIVKLISGNPSSLSKLFRKSTLSKTRITNLLATLIAWNIVKYKIVDGKILYSMVTNFDESISD